MLLKKVIRKKLLLLLTIFFVNSCGTEGIKFDPNFYVPDHEKMSIISERGDEIMCNQPEFDKFACLHIDKIIELKQILDRARLPKHLKDKALSILSF